MVYRLELISILSKNRNNNYNNQKIEIITIIIKECTTFS